MSKAFLQKFYRERQLEAEREQRDQGANQRVTINTTSTTAQDFSAATNHHGKSLFIFRAHAEVKLLFISM
jgi:hypothetical protein